MGGGGGVLGQATPTQIRCHILQNLNRMSKVCFQEFLFKLNRNEQIYGNPLN